LTQIFRSSGSCSLGIAIARAAARDAASLLCARRRGASATSRSRGIDSVCLQLRSVCSDVRRRFAVSALGFLSVILLASVA
jgi:hypothetical protein